MAPRLLLLTTASSYRTGRFADVATRLGVEIHYGVHMAPELAEHYRVPLALDLADADGAVDAIRAAHAQHPFDAILAVDDTAVLVAARAAHALGISHNAPAAVEAARNKLTMRRALEAGGVPVPWYERIGEERSLDEIAPRLRYPLVVKPLLLSGSRGVIRADDPAAFVAAASRTRALLRRHGVPGDGQALLVEGYLPGIEVALEGMLIEGELRLLALFDKPEPLVGPYFEETIYTTPSTLPEETQHAILERCAEAARAVGLQRGPVHAELRLNDDGIWLIEIAGRTIGGLCGSILEFGSDLCLEELVIREALGLPLPPLEATMTAAGVMMIPIPRAGVLRGVRGVETATRVPHITGIEITAPLDYPLVPLPEGESYLGFIFARADRPDRVEQALREAHAALEFDIEEELPIIQIG